VLLKENTMKFLLTGCFFIAALANLLFHSVFNESVYAQATTVQLPQFGIAIDADGVIQTKKFRDPSGRLLTLRAAEAKAKIGHDLAEPSKLRKVSLVRLEQELQARLNEGKPPTDAMLHLAGIQRLQYVFYYPDSGDIVIAGPAEAWVKNGVGKTVGVTTNRPTLLLEDMIAALRTYSPKSKAKPLVGCSIDPDADALVRMQAFQRTVPKVIAQRDQAAVARVTWNGLREALGTANIRVMGVSDKTHLAEMLVEADYRMKMIGIGLEPPPIRMATFLGSLSGAPQGLQRWWFTPNYECLRVAGDGNALELVGQGVVLNAEDKQIATDGRLHNTGRPINKASELFTLSFTRKYDEISTAAPVFAQLRTAVDMLVVAAYIRQADLYGKSGWDQGVFADEAAFPIETHAAPKKAPCAVNVIWKGSRMLAPAGGGVAIQADKALEPSNLLTDDRGVIARMYKDEGEKRPVEAWWWD